MDDGAGEEQDREETDGYRSGFGDEEYRYKQVLCKPTGEDIQEKEFNDDNKYDYIQCPPPS